MHEKNILNIFNELDSKLVKQSYGCIRLWYENIELSFSYQKLILTKSCLPMTTCWERTRQTSTVKTTIFLYNTACRRFVNGLQ